MDIAIVSGAASGLGLAISRKLIELGFKVYGLGGNYSSTSYSHPSFVPTAVNLADLDAVTEKVNEILNKEGNIYALVNNAKIYPSKTLEETSFSDIETVLKINLHLPILLAKLALPGLKKYQGHIINIGSSTPELSRGGPIGAASSGGLNFFGQSFFEAYRQTGVKVTSIFPQANRWRPDEVPAPAAENPQSIIDAEAVAEAVKSVVDNKTGNIITELVIRPEKIVEEPTPSILYVPYPKPKPIPSIGLRSGSPAKGGYTADKKASRNEKRKERPAKQAKKEAVEETSQEEGQEEEATMSRSARRRQRQRERRENYRQRKAEENATESEANTEEAEVSKTEVEQKPLREKRDRDTRRQDRPQKERKEIPAEEESTEEAPASTEENKGANRRGNRQNNERRERYPRRREDTKEAPEKADKAPAKKREVKDEKPAKKKKTPQEAMPTAGFDFVPGELDAPSGESSKTLFKKEKPTGGRKTRSRRNRGRTAFDHMKAGSAAANTSGPGLLPDAEITKAKKENATESSEAKEQPTAKKTAEKKVAQKKDVPAKKATPKKAPASKKTATKKTAAKKAVKKVATKKTAAKKVATKKATPAKKAPASKKTATKKTAAKKAVKKVATKKIAAKKAVKKVATKKK